MSFESATEELFKLYVRPELSRKFTYVEYGSDYVRFKEEGGNVFEIKVREIKPAKKRKNI